MFYALGKYEDGDEVKTCEVENLDLSHFDTSHVTDMTSMLDYVSSVDVLDISSFVINPGCQTNSVMGHSDYQTIILPATANNLSNVAFIYTPHQGGYCHLIYPNGVEVGNVVDNGNCESNDVTCLWGHDGAVQNAEEYMNGANTHFVDGAGYNGSRGIKVVSIEDAESPWATQFMVYTPNHVWETGDKYHFKMKVRADKASPINVQAHGIPGAYLFYDMLETRYEVTTEWQEIDYEGEITSSQDGMQTIVFLLNELKESNNFYFDDISWVPYYHHNTDDFDYINWQGGNFYYPKEEAYAALTNNGNDGSKTLTFRCDKFRFFYDTTFDLNPDGRVGWTPEYLNITEVVFDPSFAKAHPTSCSNWFYGMRNLHSITGIEYLNTNEVTDMSFMFYHCTNLTSLDLSRFDTKKVTDMYFMFGDCSSLTSLDLSGFTFNNGTRTEYMLKDCSGLETLLIPNLVYELDAETFSGVGTSSNPCALFYPDVFIPGNQVVNGNCESNDVTCLWGHDGTVQNAEEYMNGANTHFIDGAGYNGSRGIKVVSIEDAELPYDTQFMVYTPDHVWQIGDKYHFKMRVRIDKAAPITVQAHRIPGAYLTYDMLKIRYEVTPEWQEIDYEGEITRSQDGMQTITFILNELKEANNIYFDDISWVPYYFNSDDTRYIQWKGGYFKTAFLMGDINGDHTVSVTDVMMAVDYVLGLNPEGFQFNNTNIVNDNTISVTDVMAIVDIVLGLNTNHTQASSRNQ